MQTSLENLGHLERRLNIAIALDEINNEVQNRLRQLARKAKLHGFRPGKVPFKIIEQQYGHQVRQEVLGDKLNRGFGDAVREQNLKVAGYPHFEAKPIADGAQQFEYSATFEVYPEFKIGDLTNAVIKRPKLEVGTQEVDKTVEILRKQHLGYEAVDRPAQAEDQVSIDFKGSINGEEFLGGQAKDYVVVLGAKQLLEDFELQIIGTRAGDTKSFDLRFPDEYPEKTVAGKIAQFEIIVNAVKGPKLPEVDSEFARKLGTENGDVEKMRSEVKANLEKEVKNRVKQRLKNQVMQALVDVTTVEVPKALVEQEIRRSMQIMEQELQSRGINADEVKLPPEKFEPEARRRVTLGLIIAELVRTQNLQATPERVRALINEHAESYEQPEQVVKWYYQSPERLKSVESLALEENVVDWVMTHAKVEDEEISFDDLMEIQK